MCIITKFIVKLFFVSILFASLFAVDFISTKDLSRGMKLTGKTRMANNIMVDFDLTILSVIKGAEPREDSIMAQIETTLFEETGVLAGMSGSPVYYQNKLVGAVAYTMPFMKKPIVGITPIHSMLRLIEYSKKNNEDPYQDAASIYGLKPIATPLGINGAFFLDKDLMRQVFNQDKFVLVPTSLNRQAATKSLQTLKSPNHNQSATSNLESKGHLFEPGDAVALSLVSGDMSITALGTVTYVSNDYLLAFGHPMKQLGKVNLALHKAEIDGVVPLQSLSYKLGSIGDEVGAVLEDRSSAILGKIGVKSPKIPFYLAFKTPLQEKHFTYWVTQDANFFSTLVSFLSLNSLIHFESISEEATISYEVSIHTSYKDKSIQIIDEITVEKLKTGALSIARHIKQLINHIENNKFLPVNVTKIEMHLAVRSKINYYHLQKIEFKKTKYQPGKDVILDLFFENYRGGIVKKKITYTLPDRLEDGVYPIMVSSGSYFLSLDSIFNKSRYVPRNPDRLYEILNEKINNKTLSVFMFNPGSHLNVNGEEYRGLPQFVADSLIKTKTTDKAILFDFHRKNIQMPSVVVGSMLIEISVEQDVYQGD